MSIVYNEILTSKISLVFVVYNHPLFKRDIRRRIFRMADANRDKYSIAPKARVYFLVLVTRLPRRGFPRLLSRTKFVTRDDMLTYGS